MSSSAPTISNSHSPTNRGSGGRTSSQPFWILPALGFSIYFALWLVSTVPLILIAIIAAIGAVVMYRWPDLTTLVVIGLIYTNLPVVAVKIHGAPGALPAVVLALLGWPLAYRLLILRERIQLGAALPFVMLFTIVQVVGALFSKHPLIAIESLQSFLLEGLILYLVVINVLRTKAMIVKTFWVLLASAVLMGGVPFFQQVTRSFDSDYYGLSQTDSAFRTGGMAGDPEDRQPRFAGTIGEKNRYAQFMILLVPFGIAMFSIEKRQTLRTFALLATILALIGFALAFSRGAAIGFVIAVAFASLMGLLSRSQLMFVAMGTVAVLLFLPQYGARLTSMTSIFQTAAQGKIRTSESDGSIRGRLTEMGAAALVFRDHCLIGVGPGVFGEYSQEYGQIVGLRSLEAGRQAHSLPLDIAAENGTLGLIGFAGIILLIGNQLYLARRKCLTMRDATGQHLAKALLLAMILYLATALFLHLSYIRYFWLLLGLADATGRILLHPESTVTALPRFNQKAQSTS